MFASDNDKVKGEFGKIVTKVEVKSDYLDKGYYLLRNKASQLLAEGLKIPISINAVTS